MSVEAGARALVRSMAWASRRPELTPKRTGFPALSAAMHEKENVGRVLMTVGDVVKEVGVEVRLKARD